MSKPLINQEKEKNLLEDTSLSASVVFKISSELVSRTNEQDICDQVVYQLNESLGYDVIAIFLQDEKSKLRHLTASVGYVNPITPLQPGQGVSEQPYLDGHLQYTPDVSKHPKFKFGAGGSELDIPIWIDQQVIGVIVAESKEKNAFSQADFELLTAVSQITGIALEKSRLFTRLKKRGETLEALNHIMTELTAVHDLNLLLKTIVIRAISLLHASYGELGLVDEETREITIAVSHNLHKDFTGKTQQYGQGLMGKAAKKRTPIMIENYNEWHGKISGYESIYSSIAIPLLIEDRLLGVFTTGSFDKNRRFDQEDIGILLMFAKQAALAIESTRLYQKSEFENLERKRLYNLILERKEYFEALFINSPTAVITADLQGDILSWNPMAEKLFGYSSAEVIGKPLNDFVAKHPSLVKEADQYSKEVISKGQVMVTTKRTRRDGTFIDVELLALPVIVLEKMIGFIAIYHDITALKQIERELRKKNEMMSQQLVLAGEIQSSFLPKKLPVIGGWNISTTLKPAYETSGDFFDVTVLPNGNIAILIADVIDKGVGAALFMTLCWSLFRIFGLEDPENPNKLFYNINQYILNETQINQFVTAIYTVINPSTGEMVFSNAGHCPMYIRSSSDNPKLDIYPADGIPLGIEQGREWEQHTVIIHPGTTVILYTDGVVEAQNENGSFYCFKKLEESILATPNDSSQLLSDKILKDLAAFVGQSQQTDDIAIITISRIL